MRKMNVGDKLCDLCVCPAKKLVVRFGLILAASLLLALDGCGRAHPAVRLAQVEFAERNPGSKIVSARARESDADHVCVRIRFVHTPASSFPPRAGVWEMEMGYEREDTGWRLVYQKGSKYIKPAF